MLIRFFRLLSWFPLRWLQGLGAVVGALVWRLSPTVRQRALENARQAGFADPDIARQSVIESSKAVAELPFIWMRDDAVSRVVCDSWHLMEQAYTRGQGLILLTPHLGCFEIAARYCARHRPITVLYRPPRQAWLRPLIELARNNGLIRAAPASLAGVKQLLRALQAGEAVGILPDQVPSRGEGVWAPFFGKPAYTMVLTSRLARTANALPLLVFAERLPKGRGYRLYVEPVPAFSGDAAQQAAQLNVEMEKLIRRFPTQYLWSYHRYKHPPGAPPAEQAA